MKTLLLLLLLIASTQSALAKPTPIVIYDASSGVYPIAQEIASFQTAGVSLRHIDAEALPCEKARKQAPHGVDIILCEADLPGNEAGLTSYFTHRTMIQLDPTMTIGGGPVCHELMHALTRIPDNPSSRADSCVWGWLDAPGAFDVDYLQHHLVRAH